MIRGTKIDPQTGETRDFIPASKTFTCPVNADNLVKQGSHKEEKASILPNMTLKFKDKQMLTKSELMILETIAQNNFERPSIMPLQWVLKMYLDLKKYFSIGRFCLSDCSKIG